MIYIIDGGKLIIKNQGERTLSFCTFPFRDEWVPMCWKRDGL